MNPLLLEILSIIGGILVGGAYILGILGWMRRDSALQHGLSAAGCLLLGLYAFHNHAYVFVALNTLWCAAAIMGVIQDKKRKERENG